MLGELWNGGVGGSSCLANDVPVEGWDDLRPDPMPGAGYYYLVRAQSACGNGTYGSDSLGRERQPGANCP